MLNGVAIGTNFMAPENTRYLVEFAPFPRHVGSKGNTNALSIYLISRQE